METLSHGFTPVVHHYEKRKPVSFPCLQIGGICTWHMAAQKAFVKRPEFYTLKKRLVIFIVCIQMHDFSSAFTPGCVRQTDGEKEREKIDADGRLLCTFPFLRFISNLFTFIGLFVLDFSALDGLNVCVMCMCLHFNTPSHMFV